MFFFDCPLIARKVPLPALDVLGQVVHSAWKLGAVENCWNFSWLIVKLSLDLLKWSLIVLIGNYTITLYSCYLNVTLARTLSQNLQDLSRSLTITDSRAVPFQPIFQILRPVWDIGRPATSQVFARKELLKLLSAFLVQPGANWNYSSSVYSFCRSKIICLIFLWPVNVIMCTFAPPQCRHSTSDVHCNLSAKDPLPVQPCRQALFRLSRT